MVYFNREELQKEKKKNDPTENIVKLEESKINSGEIYIEDYNLGDYGFIIPNYKEATAFYRHEIIIEEIETSEIKSYFLCSGTTLKCTQGDAQSEYAVLPTKKVFINNKPLAVVSDMKPIVNIKPFGMCKSMANPTVAAATAANKGHLRKMSCIPNTVAPWSNGVKYFMSEEPVPCDKSKLICAYAGEISVVKAGQTITGDAGKGSSKNKENEDKKDDESTEEYLEIEKTIYSRNKGFKKT